MKKKVAIVVGLLVVVAIAAFAIFNPRKKTGTDVYVAKVEGGEVISVVTASGEIQARTKVNISSNVFGKIIAIPVKEGDPVHAGEVLLRIDQEQYLSEVRSLEANQRMAKVAVEQEQTRLKTYEAQLKRAEALRTEGILPEESYEQTKLAYDSSRNQLASLAESVSQADAALSKAKDSLDKTILYAPMDGKVTQLNTEVGEQVIVGTTNIPGSQIMVVSDMSEVLAEVDVDETQVVKVKLGQPVKVTMDAVEKVEYTGKVSEIRTSANKKGEVNVFGVKILLDSPDERLRPGMSAKARIEIERREGVLRIPIQAVVERTGKALAEEIASTSGKKGKRGAETGGTEPNSGAVAGEGKSTPIPAASSKGEGKEDTKEIDVVYVLHDGKAEAVRVKTGLADETHVEILSGLKDGDSVITGPYRSLRKLKHGEKVAEKKEEDLLSTESGVKVEVD